MKKNLPLLLSIISLLLQVLGYYTLRLYPAQVEKWYSNGIYPTLSNISRNVTGWIPFSIGDVVYLGVIILAVRWLWVNKWELITLSRKRYTQLFISLNIILLFFHVAWGFNYYRQPLHQSLGIGNDYTTTALEEVIQKLIQSSNTLHQQLQPVDSLPVAFTRSQSQIFEAAPRGYDSISDQFPSLNYKSPSIKESMITGPLSYMGYSGYLNPFTGEAHTNAWINNYKTPVLTLHEMAHQLGFAKENEANFIAILAGVAHDDPYFKFSAQIFALRYCLNDLYKRNPERYTEIVVPLRPGIFKNYKELTDFWQEYNGIIEEVSQATYNTYLKANNQPGGMETYSYVVALLVNYYATNSSNQ